LSITVALAGCGPAKEVEAPPPAAPAPEPDLEHLDGSRLRFFLPEGYERIPHTTSFIHRASLTSLSLLELDGGEAAEAELIKAFSEKFGVIERRQLERDGMPALSLEAEGARGVLIRSGDAVGALYASFKDPKRVAEIEGVLASVHLDPKADLDGLKLLGVELTLEDLEPHSAAVGAVLFLEPDVQPPVPPAAPALSLTYLPTPGGLTNKELGELVGSSVRHLEPDTNNMQVTMVTIDGLAGAELLTKGVKEGVAVTVFALAVNDDDGAFVFYGSVDASREGEHLPRFRALAASLHRAGSAAAPRPLR
jgi:hypothetical protein